MGKKILGVFAHEDDEVIGAGGLFALNAEQNGSNQVLCLTGYNSVRVDELKASCHILGASYEVLGNRKIVDVSRNTLSDKIKDLIILLKPEILITHDKEFDYQIEHNITHEIVMDAAQRASHGRLPGKYWRCDEILTTETHALHPVPNRIYDITTVFDKKQRAMECHESQLHKGTVSTNYYHLLNESKARLRGVQSGTTYGEAFMVRKLPIIGDFCPNLATKEV
jgi:4-oxalomesaconate hydratase